eukprot:6787969-Prymnesium_polylepis.1
MASLRVCHVPTGCHAVNDFLIQNVCPRRSPGPLRMLHAEPWEVGQGDVERSEGSQVVGLRLCHGSSFTGDTLEACR